MTTRGRRSLNDLSRLKEEAMHDEETELEDDSQFSHKRRRPWKEENRRQDRQSKKQRNDSERDG